MTTPAFDAVQVFSTSMARERERLGDVITHWLAQHPRIEIAGREVTQSSDNAFHCLTITIFYRER